MTQELAVKPTYPIYNLGYRIFSVGNQRIIIGQKKSNIKVNNIERIRSGKID